MPTPDPPETPTTVTPPPALSVREETVVRDFARGFTMKDIAGRLG